MPTLELFPRPNASPGHVGGSQLAIDWRLVFEQSTAPMFVFDTSLRIVDVNPALVRLCQMPREQIVGYDLSRSPDVQVLRLYRGTLDGKSLTYEGAYTPTLAPDVSWVSLRVSPVRDADESIKGGFAILEDRTETRRGEEALVRLASIVEGSEDAIISLDLDGRIQTWNAAAEHILGFTAVEMLGRSLRPIVPDDVWPEELRLLGAVRDGEHVTQHETTRRCKDGRLVTVSLSLSPMYADDGALAGFSSILRDVTAQRSLEAQLLQAQKMEAMGRLAGGVAHDFNNILTAIMSNAELASASFTDDDAARDELAEIKLAATRAASLTRQLLAFSRRQVLRLEMLDLNSVVADAEKMLRRVIGEDIRFVTTLDPTLGFIKADRGQLEQILMNLVVNSRDAMPSGGRLGIRTADRVVDGRLTKTDGIPAGRYVTLEVSDTGHGMDAATQAKIFEPFFTTKDNVRGTGLGLSTVYGIVQQLGGFISLRSAPGAGCCFTLYFPTLASERVATPARAVEKAPAATAHEVVLLVEDEPAVRTSAARTLRKHGYRVIEAASAEDAMALREGMPQQQIHLVVSDIVMPGANGPTLVQWLLDRHPSLRALFMSGYSDDPTGQLASIAPDARILQKPFSAADLLREVRATLD